MMGKNPLHMIAWLLLIVGGLNWGLVGINRDWNLVMMLLGSWSWLESLVYILVGLSAVYALLSHKKECKECMSGSMEKKM